MTMQTPLVTYFVPRIELRLLALVITILIECGAAWLLKYRSKDEMKAIICINVMTNPTLNYILWVWPWTYDYVWYLEAAVVFVEWGLLKLALMQNTKKLFVLSLAMNASSFLGGLVIFHWILGR